MKPVNIKVLIWMNMPSHHQSAFFTALRNMGVDLMVFYYERVTNDRKKLGWADPAQLPVGEKYVKPDILAFVEEQHLAEYVHIVPGCGTPFLRKLVEYLIKNNMQWMHWSEPARTGLRWFVSYPVKRLYASKVNKYSMGALAIGELAKADFIRWGVDKEKIYIHNYSVDGLIEPKNKLERLSLGINEKQLVFIFLGVLCRRKGTDVLFKSFARHLEKYPDSFLLLIGRNSAPKYYNKLIDKLAISDGMLQLDSVLAADVAKYLDLADILVLPSRFDGWGMVLNEAASLGLPLISSDKTGSSYHLVEHQKNGLVVKAGSEASLEQALNYYAENRHVIPEHGMRSLEIFKRHTPEVCATSFINIITALKKSI